MATLIINGKRATVSAKNFAKFHGGSIFTTMRMSDGEIYLWRRHYRRLVRHCNFFSYEVAHEDALLKIIGDNVGAKKTPRKIRIVIFAGDFAVTIETLRHTPKIFYPDHGRSAIEMPPFLRLNWHQNLKTKDKTQDLRSRGPSLHSFWPIIG